jgi:hypothetical protein
LTDGLPKLIWWRTVYSFAVSVGDAKGFEPLFGKNFVRQGLISANS